MPMKFKRIANFVGTTNKKEILSDETGNIRWLIMEIMAIRHDDGGPNGYSKINIDNVWSQAYFLLKEGYPYKLTKENFVDSEANNELFRHVSVEKELLVQYFLLPQQNNKEKVKLMTSTNILMTLQKLSTFNNLKLSNLRKALRELGYEEKQIFQIGKVFMVIENFKTK
jgi:predicted P-loop ATPase